MPASRPATAPAAAPAPRRGRTADVRGALVDAAWWVLEHEGLAGLTVRAVATRAGVAPMGVYNHLRDKDGLLMVVVTRGFEELTRALEYPPDLPPAEAFATTGLAYRQFALAHPVAYGLMFGGPLGDLDPDDPRPERQALDLAGARAFGELITAIRIGQAAGTVRPGPAEQIAWTVWSAVHGAVSLELAGGIETVVSDPNYEQVLAMITRGIAPDPA